MAKAGSHYSFTHFCTIVKVHKANEAALKKKSSKSNKKKATTADVEDDDEDGEALDPEEATASILYDNAEEELLCDVQQMFGIIYVEVNQTKINIVAVQNCDLQFDYCVASEFETGEGGGTIRVGDDDTGPSLQPYRRIVCFDLNALNKFIDDLGADLATRSSTAT